jgi:polyferredoxin
MSFMTESTKKKTRITLWRSLTQISFVFLLNPYFYSFRNVCFPILNCWGCPIAAFSCPIGALGQFLANGVFPFIVLGTLIFFGVIIGRLLCGWVCPFGLLQDLMNKIPSPKINMPSFLNYGKYLALLIMVILIPIFYGVGLTPGKTTPEDFFFCNLCPAGTLEATIPNTLLLTNTNTAAVQPAATVNGNKATGAQVDIGRFTETSQDTIMLRFLKSPRMWILLAFLVLFILIRRPFCRGACPVGAIFALFNKLSFHKLKFIKDKCIDCQICYKTCPTSHKIYNSSNSPECIRCLECQKKCPTKAIENQYF